MGLPRRLKEGHVRDFAVQRPGGQGSPSGPVWPHPGLTLPDRGDLQEVRAGLGPLSAVPGFPTSLAPGCRLPSQASGVWGGRRGSVRRPRKERRSQIKPGSPGGAVDTLHLAAGAPRP